MHRELNFVTAVYVSFLCQGRAGGYSLALCLFSFELMSCLNETNCRQRRTRWISMPCTDTDFVIVVWKDLDVASRGTNFRLSQKFNKCNLQFEELQTISSARD